MSDSNSLSRRRFLKRTTQVATAGAVVPYLVPRSVFALDGKPGANDRVHAGIMGLGNRYNRLLSQFVKDGQIVAFADCYLNKAEKVASKYKGTKAFQDYRKMLDMKDLDAIFISAPNHWHALACVHACQAGKDVYGEKPLGLTVRECRAMADAVRKYKRVFQTGSQQRSMEPNRLGCELVRTGKIGKVHTVIGYNYPSPWYCDLPSQPVPEGLDWDMWCGQAKFRPYNIDIYLCRANPGWGSFWDYCGGEITNWGSHGLDQVQWALGMDHTGPVEVWCEDAPIEKKVISKPVRHSKAALKDHRLFYRYANGTILRLENGPQGGAIFLGDNGKITIGRNRLKCEPKELVKEKPPQLSIRDCERHHIQNWLECIKTREKPVADIEIGLRSVALGHIGNIARWTGRKLRWDPEKEIFPGDDEANSYLERPQRKPYDLPKIS